MQILHAQRDLIPKPVQRVVMLTVAGWARFLCAIFAFYDPNSFFKFAIAGGSGCYYRYKGKRWARVMAMPSSVL